jgi:hypothetical protein
VLDKRGKNEQCAPTWRCVYVAILNGALHFKISNMKGKHDRRTLDIYVRNIPRVRISTPTRTANNTSVRPPLELLHWLLGEGTVTVKQFHSKCINECMNVKAVLSSFKMWFGDGGKSLYKYYQNMYLV